MPAFSTLKSLSTPQNLRCPRLSHVLYVLITIVNALTLTVHLPDHAVLVLTIHRPPVESVLLQQLVCRFWPPCSSRVRMKFSLILAPGCSDPIYERPGCRHFIPAGKVRRIPSAASCSRRSYASGELIPIMQL